MIKKLAIVSANSDCGKALVDEALKRGIDTTVFTRLPNETAATQAVQKEILDIGPDDLEPFDAVIDANSVWDDSHIRRHYLTLFHLCDCLSGSDARFLIVGDEGLVIQDGKVDEWFGGLTEHESKKESGSIFTRWFGSRAEEREQIRRMAGSQVDVLGDAVVDMNRVFEDLKKRKDVNWIYMSPSCEVENSIMNMSVFYDDYAVDMLDELESGIHYQQRVWSTCW